MNRRAFIGNGCAALASSALTGCLSPAGDRPVTFGLVADIHYADIDNSGGRHYREASSRLAECVTTMNGLRPDFLIELGDFKDLGKSRAETLAGLRHIEKVFSQFDGPRYHVLGNHDCDALTPEEFLSEISNYGQQSAKAHYRFDIGGVAFFVLDGCYTSDMRHYACSNPWTDANIPPEQLAWLENELESTLGTAVVFCHQRLDPNSEQHHLIRNAASVRDVLEKSGKVRAVFTGHQHTGGHCELNGIRYVTLPSVVDGDNQNAYALATVFPDGRISVRGWGRAKCT